MVHGRKVPSINSVNVLELDPAGTVSDDAVVMLGDGRLVTGVVMVNVTVFEGPEAFETETLAGPGNAASWNRIKAVSWPELTNVVARGEPFQFTTEDALSKFEPATLSVNPARLQ
jgi:hypothetical protein